MMVNNAILLASVLAAMAGQGGQVLAAATPPAAVPADDSSLVSQIITANTQVARVKAVGVSSYLPATKLI